jgi:hypothetical protein
LLALKTIAESSNEKFFERNILRMEHYFKEFFIKEVEFYDEEFKPKNYV